jgi:transcriptional antiterminator RfaH
VRESSSSQTGSAWAVVNTHPHREALALDHLEKQDFEAYCPLVRQRRRQATRFVDVVRPLFPGYIFVKVAPERNQWRPVLSTFGVRKLVRFGEQPGLIDAEFIAALKAREMDGVVACPAVSYDVGQKVRLQTGPFDGLVATIFSIEERNRFVVLLEIMRRQVQVRVGSDQLSAI